MLSSSDQGRSWRSSAMMRFPDALATAAEAWVVELADGRLLGTCWNLNQRDGSDYPNAFCLSPDRGLSWSATHSTGIMGQTTALAAFPDGSVLFIYNQRKHGQLGVWLARRGPSPMHSTCCPTRLSGKPKIVLPQMLTARGRSLPLANHRLPYSMTKQSWSCFGHSSMASVRSAM